MDVIKTTVSEFITAQCIKNGVTVWIAFSGGVDSRVLLTACAELRATYPQLVIKAVHVNHQLLQESTHWVEQAKYCCQSLQVPLEIVTVNIQRRPSESLEDQARQVRYQAFQQWLKPGDWLFTGHHQDDQAETVLLQLLRGAGVLGLSAISPVSRLGQAFLGRPLLGITRQQIESYATQRQLMWVEDPSNQNLIYSRNFLRQTIFPLLETRWPEAKTKLAMTASHLQAAQVLLTERAILDYQKVKVAEDRLAISRLNQLSQPALHNVLRYWIKARGHPLPSEKILTILIAEVMRASEEAMPCVTWKKTQVRRFQDELYLLPALPAVDPQRVLTWDLQQPLQLPSDLGCLVASWVKGEGLRIAPTDAVTIRFRQGGEGLYLPGRQGKQSLRKLFQVWRIPPWQRDRIPLLYINSQLAAVIGYGISREFYNADVTIMAWKIASLGKKTN